MDYPRILKNAFYCSLVSLIPGLLLALTLYWAFGIQVSGAVEGNAIWIRIILAVLVAPIWETLFFFIVNVATKQIRLRYRFILGAVVFLGMHIFQGYEKSLLSVVPAFVYSYAYFYIGRTRLEGFWIAALAHLIHNSVLCAIWVVLAKMVA